MHTSEVLPLTVKMGSMALVPLIVVLIPIVGALIVALLHKRPKVRNAVAITANAAAFALLVYIYKPVVTGITVGGHLYRGIEYSLPNLFGVGLNFRVDTVGLLIALVTSFIYTLSCIYATSYMAHEHAQTRYFSFVLLTLSANLGVLLVKDFFSLFIFFELMAIFSYVLVIHEEDTKAMEAGKLYIYMCIVGGLALLVGIILLYFFTGTANMVPMAALIEKTMPHLKYTVAFLMIIGFGSKAGIFFLHIWLPEAHPIAPTPASALLSGLMVKVGVYGIIRTTNTLFAPIGAQGHGPSTLTNIGYILIWAGIVTMFCGMVNALLSANCKRLLAYSTVSQIGYIILGIGCAAYLGTHGAMGMAGTLYHVINHAVFKSALFLSIGAVYLRTRELDMNKLGGLWRNMPLTAMVCLIAVFSIAGIPGFGGFASKTILHHAILEAAEKNAVLKYAEILFMVTAFGTFCYTSKMFIQVFLGKRPNVYKDVAPEPTAMKLALIPLALIILIVGLRPNFLIEQIIGPALAFFGYDPASHPYHILYNIHATAGTLKSTIPLLYDPKTFAIFSNADVVKNLMGTATVILGGSSVFVLGYRFNLFNIHSPAWTSVKFWITNFSKGFVFLVSRSAKIFNSLVDAFIVLVMVKIWLPKTYVEKVRGFSLTLIDKITQLLDLLVMIIHSANSLLDRAVTVSLVDLWVSRIGISFMPPSPTGGPSPAVATAGMSGEATIRPEGGRPAQKSAPEELSFSFIDICCWIKSANDCLDRWATKLFVDSLLAGSAATIIETVAPAPEEKSATGKADTAKSMAAADKTVDVFKWLKDMNLNNLCRVIRSFNDRLDKAATTVFVDTWLASSSSEILEPSPSPEEAPLTDLESARLLDTVLVKVFQRLKQQNFAHIYNQIKYLNRRFDEIMASISVDGPSEGAKKAGRKTKRDKK